jgi:hypothetical protein
MAPHLEIYHPMDNYGDEYAGMWVVVCGTYHNTNDYSEKVNAVHKLVFEDSKKYKEAADHLGPVCDELSRS